MLRFVLATMPYSFPLLCVLLAQTVAAAVGNLNGELVGSTESPVHPRQLRAASLIVDMAKRGLEVPLKYDMTLHYVEGSRDLPKGILNTLTSSRLCNYCRFTIQCGGASWIKCAYTGLGVHRRSHGVRTL